jgi:hypothetical protein
MAEMAQSYAKAHGPQYRTYEGGEAVRMHIIVAEKALGHHLPEGAVVHHVNEDKRDYSNANLVICQNIAYHHLLHRRMRALAASGHADWRVCKFCRHYDSPTNLVIHEPSSSAYHKSCQSAYRANYYQTKGH